MVNLILNNKNRNYAKKCIDEIVDIGLNFKLQENFREKHITENIIQDILKMPVDTTKLEDIIMYMKENILPYCSNFGTEKFMGFPDAGNSIAGISGAVLSDFLQQNLINSSFCAPIATYMEIAVIKWLREIVGYKEIQVNNIWDVGGIITYGGTGSNSIAMLLARENHRQNTMKNGVIDPNDYKVVIPKGIGHYSIKSSLMWIGCGDNVIEVPTVNYKYDLEELKKVLIENKGKIMSVVAYVGDSRSMTIDNLTQIYKIVKEVDDNIWLHADACHGFSLGFSEKLKSKISGIELFDSISTDPHKVLAVPYTISALLLKNPETIKKVTTTSDLIMKEDYAFGQITPFIGSKSWMSLKVWFAFQNIGKKGIAEIIEKRCQMAKYLKEILENRKEYIVLNDVDINSVMFLYVGNRDNITMTVDEINSINKQIKKKMDIDGIYFLHQFSIIDDNKKVSKNAILYPLRYMSGNDNITNENINNMIKYIDSIIRDLNKIKGE
ncbi:MAG: pyridoxal-dependent decarboxylase [Clostridia bacterium]|nr:pyridoxal-dependent decarboxylase [Clostridia bacterium]